jgi:hypothetical protein
MSECRNLNCGYCGAEVYEINGYTYNHDSGGTGHDCADEIKAKLDAALLQIDAMKPVVEAAREMIGQNVTRPYVYEATDKGKHKLALALQGFTEKPKRDL